MLEKPEKEITVSLIGERVMEELRRIGEVRAETGKAVVCCVGDNLRNRPGVARMVFIALHDINIDMISQGASAINITFVVGEDKLPQVIRGLHDELFQTLDPDNFANEKEQ